MIKIFHWIFDFGDRVQFESTQSTEDTIRYLNDRITKSKQKQTTGVSQLREPPVLVGKINKESVVLWIEKMGFGKIWKPYFYGEVSKKNGKSILSGVFTMTPVVKIFTSLIFVVFFLGGILAVFPIEKEGSGITQMNPFGSLLFFVPILVVMINKRMFRNETELILKEIRLIMEEVG